jgi:hypothetical protein
MTMLVECGTVCGSGMYNIITSGTSQLRMFNVQIVHIVLHVPQIYSSTLVKRTRVHNYVIMSTLTDQNYTMYVYIYGERF